MSSYREVIEYTKKEIKEYMEYYKTDNIVDKSGIYPKEKFKQAVVNGEFTPYIISSYGRLFSVNYHSVPGLVRECIQRLDKDGYCIVTLTVAGVSKTRKIHRLVAEAFIPKVEGKTAINHINGIKTDNHVWNLEWCNNSENVSHAFRIGLHGKPEDYSGENVYCHKYTNEQINKVCELLESNVSFIDIEKETGVKRYTVCDIFRGRKWKHISKNYNFDDYYHGRDIARIKLVCELLESNKYTQAEIAKMTDVDVKKVFNILTGHSDSDISKDYDFSNYKFTSVKINK